MDAFDIFAATKLCEYAMRHKFTGGLQRGIVRPNESARNFMTAGYLTIPTMKAYFVNY